MAFRPHRFGRYIIVDPIAVGGMAEIYRARLAASKEAKEGPDRIIVIKKVIANLSQNSEFIQMFEEEIKITVGLTHPNIIQIYDYGKFDDQYFMAMEYVEGKNLRQFVKRLAEMKSMFSIDMSCHIISQVCQALSYAHGFKDRLSGKGLGIVHRDISPQNVMISYDGAVKLFDFGIAKAKSANEATRAGVIKGKPSYLSPEQINGEELDGRCDIFALGIVLWELLTAKRLFVAETDMGVLRLIQSAKIEPPSTFNPAVPQSLDSIVLKSLTRDKNKRYQGAEEFQRDLHKFLYSFNPSFNPADLSYYAQELFKSEIREDRDRLSKSLSIEPVEDPSRVEETNTKGSQKLSNKLAEGLISTTDFNREMMDQVAAQTGTLSDKPLKMATMEMAKPKSVSIPPPVGGAAAKGDAPQQTGISRAPKIGTPPRPNPTSGEGMVIPPWSKSSGSGSMPRAGGSKTQTSLNRDLMRTMSEDSGKGGRNFIAVVVVLFVGIVFTARHYGLLCGTPLESIASGCGVNIMQSASAPRTAPEASVAPVSQEPAELKKEVAVAEKEMNRVPATPEAMILIRTKIPDYKVIVNGRSAFVNNNQIRVPLKERLALEVSKRGFQTQRFVVPPLEKAGTFAYDVPAIEVPMGNINFNTLPSASVAFYLNDEKLLEGVTPVKDSLPAGMYRVHIENKLLGIVTDENIVVDAGKTTTIEKIIEVKK